MFYVAAFCNICAVLIFFVRSVYSFSSQWVEWFVTVPHLAYLACAVVNKTHFGRAEVILIAGCALMIFTGLMLIVDHTRNYLYFLTSFICLLLVPVLSKEATDRDRLPPDQILVMEQLSTPQDTRDYLFEHQQKWREKILGRFYIICYFFPVVYTLGALHIITPHQTMGGFIIGSMIGKLIFNATLGDSFIQLSDKLDLIKASVVRSNETRRTFLRYVFHELRVPLNSLAVGMQMLEEVFPPSAISQSDRQVIENMQFCTAHLVDNVNQVLALHRLREGELKLTHVPFEVQSILKQAISASEGILEGKSLNLFTEINNHVPDIVVGDQHRLQLMLQGLLNSTVPCIQNMGTLHIRVSSYPPDNMDIRSIHFRKPNRMQSDQVSFFRVTS